MKTVLVTGGVRRLGYAIASFLASSGWRVFASTSKVRSAVSPPPGVEILEGFDLSDGGAADRLYKTAAALSGGRVVVCSAVRFWRDVSGMPFAAKFTPRMRTALASRVEQALGEGFVRISPQGTAKRKAQLRAAGVLDRESEERRAVLFRSRGDETCAVLVGGPRTIGISAVRAGLDLAGAFKQASAADDAIASAVPYAFWPRAGYLAADPAEVGLGFVAEATLHLAAAAELLDGEAWEGTLAAAEKLGFEVEAAPAGEAWSGMRPPGFAKFTAVPAAGECEEDVLARTKGLVRELVLRETALRKHLACDRDARAGWEERTRRNLQLARMAQRCEPAEAFAWLAGLRLPALTDFPGVDADQLDRCLRFFQPFVCYDETCTPEEWARRVKDPLQPARTARAKSL